MSSSVNKHDGDGIEVVSDLATRPSDDEDPDYFHEGDDEDDDENETEPGGSDNVMDVLSALFTNDSGDNIVDMLQGIQESIDAHAKTLTKLNKTIEKLNK